MLFVRALSGVVLALTLAMAEAQMPQVVPDAAPAQPAGVDAAPAPGARTVPEWRRTDGYPFPARADVTRRLQFVAQAMQLREYCADATVANDFVRAQLQRFSSMTGREENCRTLLDY